MAQDSLLILDTSLDIDSIHGALQQLTGSIPIILVSNEPGWNADAAWENLGLAGLHHTPNAVFTPRELGAAMPAPTFYRQLESLYHRSPDQVILISAAYIPALLGAWQAGWRTVWMNPQHQPAPGLMPLHDAEIASLTSLSSLWAQLALPAYNQALTWLVAHGTPYNILAHVQLVAAVTYELAVWLCQAGETLQPLLAHRGALLHDLCKYESIRLHQHSGERSDHARLAHDFLLQQGQPELAQIADRHMPVSSASDERAPLSWEQKLVHFTDKMAEGTRVVLPAERIQTLAERYPEFRAEIEASLPYLLQLQDEICQSLKLTPVQLFQQLSANYQPPSG